MNLTSFLKQIDEVMDNCSKKQLADFIHEAGRGIPENAREEFLYKLHVLSDGTRNKESVKCNIADDREEYENIMNDLERIDSGRIFLEEILNEEYDDWYDNNEDEFFYKDDNDIAEVLANACDYIHKCMDTGNYSNGFEVGRRFFSVEVSIKGDYCSDETFDAKDMEYHELLNRDVKNTLYDTLYCGYMSTHTSEDRIGDLYDVINNSNVRDITMERLLQHGDELPDFDNFLDKWIGYLGLQQGRLAEALFNESVALMNDPHKACELADRFIDMHPGLYLHLLSSDALTTKDVVMAGYEAIGKLPVKYIVRSRMALKIADRILQEKLPDNNILEACYYVAYESDTTPVNYLRALMNGYDTPKKRELLDGISAKMRKDKGGDSLFDHYYRNDFYGEQDENRPGKNRLVMLGFLEGRFKYVMQYHLSKKEALGWSGTFMKQGISVFLLYLHEGEWNSPGIRMMIRKAMEGMGFSEEAYNEGLKHEDKNEESLYESIFRKWRALTPMNDDYKSTVLDKIESLIEMRTEGIMNANRRNYYGECASYIAALGEVMESKGENGVKQGIMAEYRDRYSRRSAFRAELKTYGLRG